MGTAGALPSQPAADGDPAPGTPSGSQFKGGLRGADGKGAVEKDAQMASDLPAGTCRISRGEPSGSQAGFTWFSSEPTASSPDKMSWGLSASFDNSKDRTFADWYFSNSALLGGVLNAGTVPSMNVGQTLLGDKGPVTAKGDASLGIVKNRTQVSLVLEGELTAAKVKSYTEAGADNPVRYAWQGKYTKDNPAPPYATRGPNATFNALVNPWPSENIECNPITVSWENFDKHVIVEGAETKVGHINVPKLATNSDFKDDSLSRMVVEAYDGKGKFIGTSNTQASGGEQRLRIDDNGDIYFTWPKYRGTDLATDKNVSFSVLAQPRTVDQLQAAIQHENGGYGHAFESSNALPRYNKPNVIDSKSFSLDDTEYHAPKYDKTEATIISGVEGPTGPITTEPQKVTFTQLPDLIKDLAKKKGDGGFEAVATLDEKYVYEGWTVEMDDDYNVTVTAPDNPRPGTFARPTITVEYSNGSTDVLELLVVVDPNNTQVTDLVRPSLAKGKLNEDITAQVGLKPIMKGHKAVHPAKYEIDPATVPDGWTVTVDNTGKVTAKADDTVAPGTIITPKVKATYPDQTTDEIETQFQAVVSIKIPYYDTVTNKPSANVSLKPTLPERGLSGSTSDEDPKRYTFQDGKTEYTVEDDSGTWIVKIDETTGEITTTIPRTAPEGYILDVPVLAYYDNYNKPRQVKGTVVVIKGDIVPTYPAESTGPNQAVTHQVQDAPKGSKFSFGKNDDGSPITEQEVDGWKYKVDPNTGVVSSTPPADAKPGDKNTINVTVTTPDGSTPLAPVTTVVKLSNNWEAEPTYPVETVYPGETATLPLTLEKPDNINVAKDSPYKLGDVPAGWNVSIDDNGQITATAPADAKPGDQVKIPVTVTYEDGSTDTAYAVVNVVDVPTREVPFDVEYKYDDSIPAGTYKVEQKGVPGAEAQDKEGNWKQTKDPVNEVVVIGTKPAAASKDVTWTEPLPFPTIVRENPALAPGETKVVQEGKNGEATYKAAFTSTNGEAKVEETKERVEPVERIIEYGPRLADSELVTETTRKIPFETKIVFDDTLAAGEQKVDKQGIVGEEKVTSTQKLVDGKPSGDPVVETTTVTQKQDAVIRVGTKTEGETTKSIETEVPFGVKIEFDPEMPAGESKTVTEGKPGKKTITVTQKVTNSQPDGEATVEEKVTEQPVDQVIKVGTKPSEAAEKVSWTAQVPFAVETRPNPELKPGEIRVVQKGVPGEKTYTADFSAKGSDASVKAEEKQTKEPVNEIIEYGPSAADSTVVTKTEKPVPFETKIVFDDSLKAGEQVVDQQGENGTEVVTSTQKIVDGKPSGDPEVTTERTKEPKNAVIRVGTKTTGTNTESFETEVPFKVVVKYDPNMPAGESKVTTEGKPGKKTVTIERDITNSQPGDPTMTEKVTKEPVDQVITVGTKQATATDSVEWTEPIPYGTTLRPNPDLAPGETKVVQEGKNGEAIYKATFSGTNGEAKVEESKDRVEPVERIIEYGPKVDDSSVVTKTEKPVPFETKIVFDDTLEAGKQVVDTQGKLGTDVVTSTQKIVNGKPAGDPEVSTERTEDPTDAVIRVGTKTTGTVTKELETEVPFGVKVIYDPTIPAGETKVDTEGKPGKKEVTITQKVTNSNPDGEATVTEKVTEEPVDQVIRVGTKPTTATDNVEWKEPIPYPTTVRTNPALAPGEVKVVQEGKNGEVKYTAKFTAVNGETAIEQSQDRTEPVERIIEVGPKVPPKEWKHKTTAPLPFETVVVIDDNLEAGKKVIDQKGVQGEETITITQKIVNGQPVGDADETREQTKAPVKQIIRVGGKSVCDCSKVPNPKPNEPSPMPTPPPSRTPNPDGQGSPSVPQGPKPGLPHTGVAGMADALVTTCLTAVMCLGIAIAAVLRRKSRS